MRREISECAPIGLQAANHTGSPVRSEPSYDRLSELARLCWHQAHLTQDQAVARLLHKMAHEFQEAAARLDSGKLPDLGDPNDDKPRV